MEPSEGPNITASLLKPSKGSIVQLTPRTPQNSPQSHLPQELSFLTKRRMKKELHNHLSAITYKKRFDKFRSSQLNEIKKMQIQQRPNNGSMERSLRKRERPCKTQGVLQICYGTNLRIMLVITTELRSKPS